MKLNGKHIILASGSPRRRELLSGLAEMVKYGFIADDALLKVDDRNYEQYILRAGEIKREIVEEDFKEHGYRKVLNFGHTFGHALEELSLSAGKGLSHGYAVLYGMIAELYLSVTKLGCEREVLQQLSQIMMHTYGKPACKCSDRERLIALMKQDKKNERAAEINVTLLRTVGSPVVNQTITADEAAEAWEYLFSL